MSLNLELTDRQSQILKAIIEEHIATAQPIASVELVLKRNLAVSGATVRNIMADLVRSGFLRMGHVSSGRTPTDRAYRYYVNGLMNEEAISVLEEMALKQKVWESRFEDLKLLRDAVQALCDVTEYMSFGISADGYAHFAGSSKIFDIPEFFEIDVTKAVFRLVDDYALIRSVLDRNFDQDVCVVIGREIGLANMDPISIIFGRVNIGPRECYIGLITPARNKYDKNIPLVRHMIKLLNEVSGGM